MNNAAQYIEPETAFANMLFIAVGLLLLSILVSVGIFIFGRRRRSVLLQICALLPLACGTIPLIRAIRFNYQPPF